MSKIHKFSLAFTAESDLRGTLELSASRHFEPLAVGVVQGAPFLWAIVNHDDPKVIHTIRAVYTGEDLGQHSEETYLGSALMDDGTFVIHYFYEGCY